jgi:hypothetical protein
VAGGEPVGGEDFFRRLSMQKDLRSGLLVWVTLGESGGEETLLLLLLDSASEEDMFVARSLTVSGIVARSVGQELS